MHIFYTPGLTSDHYTLSEEESKHCVRVLRLNRGDKVILVDGKGGYYEAAIEHADARATTLRVLNAEYGYRKRNHYLHIALAPTKNIDRLEWFLEKATEIGIDEITPIICDRSERRDLKTERLNRVITSAVKQSIKAYHPKLNEALKFRDFLDTSSAKHKFIAHCIDSERFALKDEIELHSDYLVLIGPEGDFTEMEIDSAMQAGYRPISFGDSRLRTETAALQACFEINFLNR